MITDEMKQAGARVLVDLGLQPTVFGADAIAETIFEEMLEASPYKAAVRNLAEARKKGK